MTIKIKIKNMTSVFYKLASILCYICLASSGQAALNINVDGGSSRIASGVIAGVGGINKTGLGTLTLSAANTYTGLTTVSAGELLITGSILGDATVNANTILGGTGDGITTGIIGGNVVNNGIVRTNDTTGSHLSIQGTYTQTGTASFLAKASPLAFDYLAVTGDATVTDSILNILVQQGMYPTAGITYPILTAANIIGDFLPPVNFSPTGGTVPDVTLAIAKVGNEYRLTVSGIEHTYDSMTTVNATQLATASAPMTLTNAEITSDTTIAVPITLETGGAFEVGEAAAVTFSEQVILPAVSTFNVAGDVKFTDAVAADAGSEITFTGGGKVTFDAASNGSVMLGGIVVGHNTEIAVNNDLAAESLTLNSTATLSGTGTIQNNVTGGEGKPGGSIGTLNFGANYSPNSLTIQFRPDVGTIGGDASKVTVGQTATLTNIPLRLIPVPAAIAPAERYPRTFNAGTHEYTIVTADKIVGEFATLEAPDIAGWSYALDYTDDYRSLLVKLTVNADTTLETEARVQGAVANFPYDTIAAPYLRHLPLKPAVVHKPSSRAGTKTAHSKAKGSTGKQAKKSRKGGEGSEGGEGGGSNEFRNLMPAFRAGFRPQAGDDLTTQRRDQLIAALADYGAIDVKSSNKRHTLWFEPFVQSANNKAFKTTPHTKDNAQGVMVGYHYMTLEKHVMGLAAMALFGRNSQPSDKRNKSTDKTFAVGPYFSFGMGPDWQYDGSLMVMLSESKQKQHKTEDTVQGIVIGKPKSITYVTSHTLHRLFGMSKTVELDVFAGVDYSYSDRKKYTEQGNSALTSTNDRFERKDWDAHVGAEITKTWHQADKSKIEFSLQGMMTYDITYSQKRIEKSTSHASANAAALSSSVPSAGMGRVLWECEVGIGYSNPTDSQMFELTGMMQLQRRRISKTGMVKWACKF